MFSSHSLWIIYVEFISLMIGYITFSQWVAVYLSHLKQKNMKVRAVRNIANCKKCFHKNRLSWIGLKCIDSFKNSLSLRKPNLWVLGFHPWKKPWSIVWENQGSWKVKLDCITLLVPKNAPPTPPRAHTPYTYPPPTAAAPDEVFINPRNLLPTCACLLVMVMIMMVLMMVMVMVMVLIAKTRYYYDGGHYATLCGSPLDPGMWT